MNMFESETGLLQTIAYLGAEPYFFSKFIGLRPYVVLSKPV